MKSSVVRVIYMRFSVVPRANLKEGLEKAVFMPAGVLYQTIGYIVRTVVGVTKEISLRNKIKKLVI